MAFLTIFGTSGQLRPKTGHFLTIFAENQQKKWPKTAIFCTQGDTSGPRTGFSGLKSPSIAPILRSGLYGMVENSYAIFDFPSPLYIW